MTISILGRQIKVVIMTDKDLSIMAELENCLGLFKDDTIYLADSLSGTAKRRVLLHEAAHAILSISGVTNLLEDNVEEAICDAMEAFNESDVFLLLPKL